VAYARLAAHRPSLALVALIYSRCERQSTCEAQQTRLVGLRMAARGEHRVARQRTVRKTVALSLAQALCRRSCSGEGELSARRERIPKAGDTLAGGERDALAGEDATGPLDDASRADIIGVAGE
jgi:hypothetical protein